MKDPNLVYLFAAGLIFWVGLWFTTGWLILRVRRLERETASGSDPDVHSNAGS